MRASSVVKFQVSSDRCPGIADGLIGSEVNLLVFHGLPEPLNEVIVAPSASAVHADLDVLSQQDLREVDGGELRTYPY